MKKLLTLILSLCLVFSLAACNNSEGQSSEPSTDDVGAFEKPEDYSAVLMASINPQIKMYLADGGIVLAVEAVNEDAEQIVDEILTEGADYKTVIKAFVTAANSKGFIKDGATIEFEIAEQKNNKLNSESVLAEASLAAENAATELNISLEVKTNVDDPVDETNSNTDATEQPTDNTEQTEAHTHTYSKATCTEAAKCACGATNGSALGHSWQSSTCKTPKTCKTCGVTEGGKGDHTYSNGACTVCGAAAPHTHSYSKANCTEAAKCSCGATNGSALGHSWQPATCKAPKTCKTCGATEGSKGDHTYINGVCSVCDATSVLNPKTNLSTNEYVGNLNVSGDMLIGAALQFDGEACVVVDRYFNSVQTDPSQTPIVFEGKNYYSEGGGQDPHYYELTDTEILVKGSFWGEDADTVTIKLVLQGNGMLKVTYSTNAQFPVGTILSTNINDVLR